MMTNEGKVFLFKVSLNGKIYREMVVKGSTTLFHFAETIVTSFDFKFDHSFGFYSKLGDIYRSTEFDEVYTLFYDTGMADPEMLNERSVKNSYVHTVFKPGKRMTFHFDYGDDWDFKVWCRRVFHPEEGKTYPEITKKKGEAPPQYPDYDEDDDE